MSIIETCIEIMKKIGPDYVVEVVDQSDTRSDLWVIFTVKYKNAQERDQAITFKVWPVSNNIWNVEYWTSNASWSAVMEADAFAATAFAIGCNELFVN